MSAERAALATLIDSVADGTPIDWDALDAAASDDDVRRRLRHLRLVARLAAVHGGDVADGPADTAVFEAGTAPNAAPEGAIGRWGHLLLIEKIGEGSFGEVYHARDPWLDREVALKLLRHPPGGDSSLRRLLGEARTLARVRHQHVVAVHGADVHEGRVGIWMELLRGQTFEDRLTTQGPLSAAEAAVAGQDLCRALAAVHAAGLVHRDVKASNVMREEGGRLVLMDFGAGELRDLSVPERSNAAGTPLYLAPELLRGEPATPQTDLYALGVLLYRLVTGSYPVSAKSLDALRAAHAQGERIRLRDARPGLPDAFVAVVEKALDPDPTRRFATAGEMLDALSLVGGKPKGWIPPWHAVAAAAVLVAAMGIWQWFRVTPPSPPAGIHLVAVLPLWADGGVDEDFANGMTDAIIQELSVLETVRVMPYAAVKQFTGRDRQAAGIVGTLKAESPLAAAGGVSLIGGSIRRDGNDVRINIRLVQDGTVKWSRPFDRPFQDLVSLQQDVARRVGQDLPVVLTAASQTRWSRSQAIAPESLDQYVRGRAWLNKGSRASIERAIELFTEAIRLDRRNAYALAALASANAQLAGGRSASPENTIAAARSAARAALALDPGSAEAHAVLAEMSFFADWDWTAAEEDYRRALALNPSLEYARERYSMFLASRGRLREALTEIEEARRVNPASHGLAATHGGLLAYAGRFPEAAREHQNVLEEDPRHVAATVGLARVYNATREFDRALALYEPLHAQDPRDSFLEGEIAQALAGLGRRSEAFQILARLEHDAASGARLVQPGTVAYVHASLGQRDEAFKWLLRAVQTRSIGVLWLRVDPRVNRLRDDARFESIVREFERQ